MTSGAAVLAALATFAGSALETLLRWGLGLIFLTAGLSKAAGAETRSALAALALGRGAPTPGEPPSPPWLAGWMLLGLAEAAASALVLAGFRGVAASALLAVLLVLFTAYLAWLLRRGGRRRCRCGGLLGDQVVRQALLLRNAVLLAAAVLLLVLEATLPAKVSVDCALAGCLPLGADPGGTAAPAALWGSAAGLVAGVVALLLYRRGRPRAADLETPSPPRPPAP